MCRNPDHLLTSTDVREAYIKPRSRPWRKVRYANVEGRAIYQGCIILGKTDDVEAASKAFEKDLALHPALLTNAKVELKGVAISGKIYRWTNRTVPYYLPPGFPAPERIHQAFAHWHAKTSIRFKPQTNEPNYIVFNVSDSGCASAIGMQGGAQDVLLGADCSVGNAIHELGHSVGLWHEQAREDRDQFVEVLWDNIDQDAWFNYDRDIEIYDDVGSYDFASIMHYSLTSFQVNGQPTMRVRTPLPPGATLPAGTVIGQRDGLSAGDIATVEALYKGIPAAHG